MPGLIAMCEAPARVQLCETPTVRVVGCAAAAPCNALMTVPFPFSSITAVVSGFPAIVDCCQPSSTRYVLSGHNGTHVLPLTSTATGCLYGLTPAQTTQETWQPLPCFTGAPSVFTSPDPVTVRVNNGIAGQPPTGVAFRFTILGGLYIAQANFLAGVGWNGLTPLSGTWVFFPQPFGCSPGNVSGNVTLTANP